MNYDHGQKKETLHRSFKSANKLVELGLKWKNKPEDLWHIQQLEMQCGIHHHNPAQPHQSIQAPIAQQKKASGGHWHLVIAADALISLACPVVPPTTTHFLTTQWAPNYFSSNFKQRKSLKANVGNPRQLIIWGLKVHHERIKRKQLESHLGYERCLELYSHGQEGTSQAKMQWSPKLQSHTPSCLPFCPSLLHRSTAAPKPTSKGAYQPTSKAAFLLLHIYI